MWKTAIVMTLIVSRLADAAPAVDGLAVDPYTDTGVSSQDARFGQLAEGRPEGVSTWSQHGIASVASDGQKMSQCGDAMYQSTPQQADAAPSFASAFRA